MSKTITVKCSELGTLRMAVSNERKYNKIADLAPDCEPYKPNDKVEFSEMSEVNER